MAHGVKDMKTKTLILTLSAEAVLLVVCFAFVGALWLYASPYFALQSMQTAAVERDAKKFSSYIDFPLLRENLKAELNAKMLSEMSKNQSPQENPYSGLALTMGPVMVNTMVDAYISPAGIEMLFKVAEDRANDKSKPFDAFNQTILSQDKVEVRAEYISFNEFEVSYRTDKGGESKLVFERRGLSSWKLVNSKLP